MEVQLATAPGRTDRDNEDFAAAAPGVLVLLDGAGTPSGLKSGCLHSVAWYARTLGGLLLAEALDTDEHAADLLGRVEKLAEYRNREGGFWVAGTDPAAAHRALTGSVPLTDVTAVALLSDGASRLIDRFDLLTWPDALNILREYGPERLIHQTREAEADDPGGRRWPRGKATDDATVIYARLAPSGWRGCGGGSPHLGAEPL